MSYQVLARKWRPRNFLEMVGQEHVLKVLRHALDNDRVHHAFLFTGTRGVGKTTVARILAKALNCETGVTSEPCGECKNCLDIDAGRFVDLIEVDAASRTKVDDTRDLLENVQYAPSYGRYKVYLIDEVHMLSLNSFNALLKTLEEPPSHVKFLLATTDPQKLPVTILSRCLQFHLKCMTLEQICGHLQSLLEKENVTFEQPALIQIARAAEGSMRDALSLLDQAISMGAGQLLEADTREMLGTIEQGHIIKIISALADIDAPAIMRSVNDMAEHAADFQEVLNELIETIHHIALAQIVPDAVTDTMGDRQSILDLAGRISREDIQLYYQIALIGRRDLPLSPNPRSGFEMVMLRLLAFTPGNNRGVQLTSKPAAGAQSGTGVQQTASQSPSPVVSDSRKVEPKSADGLVGSWNQTVQQLDLGGLAMQLAKNCSARELSNGVLHLILDESMAHLNMKSQQEHIEAGLSEHFGMPIKVLIEVGHPVSQTVAQADEQQSFEKQKNAESSIHNDPFVQSLQQEFGATIQDGSIKPH